MMKLYPTVEMGDMLSPGESMVCVDTEEEGVRFL